MISVQVAFSWIGKGFNLCNCTVLALDGVLQTRSDKPMIGSY